MKKIIVTGSNGLIGSQVKKFLSKKSIVISVDKKEGLDLNEEKDVISFFKKNSDAQYLINLHGLNHHISSKKEKKNTERKEFLDYHLNNVYSLYLTNKYFIKYCNKGKGIINFASMYGVMSPKHFIYNQPKDIFYVTSKFSVVGLTKYFASFYGDKVNVNCIVNGGIIHKQPLSFKKKIEEHIPKKRMMRVTELFGILKYLCSEESSYTNGSIITIDGGYSTW